MTADSIEIILTMFPGPERDTLVADLEEQSYEVALCDSGDCIFNRTRLRAGEYVLILDTMLSGPDTEEILESLSAGPFPVRTLLITDPHTANMSGVWAALGVWGYLLRPVNFGLLTMYLSRMIEDVRQRRQSTALASWLSRGHGAGLSGVFHSQPMKDVRAAARAAAEDRSPVLLLGENGTDKRAVAFEIHASGARHNGPFISVNCAAVPPGVLETLIFDPAPGSMDAPRDSAEGAFYSAHTGTLFLDEITCTTQPLQERLLDVLLRARRSGAWPDTRITAASSAGISLEVGRGRFDAELYGLLAASVINVPPLRERHEDIPELTRRYITEAGLAPGMRFSLSDAAFDILANYYWPGNERELKNVAQRAAARATAPSLDAEDVLPLLGPVAAPVSARGHCVFPSLELPLEEIEKRYIARVLKHFNFHRESTARSLGVSRKTLYSKIREYGLIERLVRDEID